MEIFYLMSSPSGLPTQLLHTPNQNRWQQTKNQYFAKWVSFFKCSKAWDGWMDDWYSENVGVINVICLCRERVSFTTQQKAGACWRRKKCPFGIYLKLVGYCFRRVKIQWRISRYFKEGWFMSEDRLLACRLAAVQLCSDAVIREVLIDD